MKVRQLVGISLIGLGLAGCVSNPHTAVLTPVLGAAGGLAGSKFGKGTGNVAATIGGVLLGSLVGNHFGGIFDGVGNNRNAINRNQLQLNQIRTQQQQQELLRSQSPSPIFSQAPYSHPRQNSIPLNCSVRKNYVVCNGS